jgi:hypothetical protein
MPVSSLRCGGVTEGELLQARVQRSSDNEGPWRIEAQPIIWSPARTAAIICDMWEPHALDCKSATRRVAEMAPHMNTIVRALRNRGALIVHAPSACMDYYRDAPGRHRAIVAPYTQAPVAFDWQGWDPMREAPLPMAMTDSESCSCDLHEPCRTSMPPVHVWSRQIASIEIADEDAISDDGQEVFNLLSDRAIDLVVLMGVHANRCVLGRPFGNSPVSLPGATANPVSRSNGLLSSRTRCALRGYCRDRRAY